MKLYALFLTKAENLNEEILYVDTGVFKIKSALVRHEAVIALIDSAPGHDTHLILVSLESV